MQKIPPPDPEYGRNLRKILDIFPAAIIIKLSIKTVKEK